MIGALGASAVCPYGKDGVVPSFRIRLDLCSLKYKYAYNYKISPHAQVRFHFVKSKRHNSHKKKPITLALLDAHSTQKLAVVQPLRENGYNYLSTQHIDLDNYYN